MSELLTDLWRFEFLRHALLAGILASIACGIIGSLVVVKRIVFIAGGISHTAYGGIGLGHYFGFNPIIGATIFSLGAACTIAWIRFKVRQLEDTLIGIMWAMGMAIGIFLIDKTPGYAPNLMSYLFGSILTVPASDLYLMLLLDIFIVLAVIVLFKEFQALTFDEEFAEVSGIPVGMLNVLLFCLIALTVVVLIRVVGVILVIALLTIPPAMALQFVPRLKVMMVYSIALGIVFIFCGLAVSAAYNVTSGAAIVFTAGLAYFVSLAVKSLTRRLLRVSKE